MTIAVVAENRDADPVLIDVNADCWRKAKRQALFVARTARGMVAPKALTDHEAALAIRRAVARITVPMPAQNGGNQPFWKRPTRIADCYDKR